MTEEPLFWAARARAALAARRPSCATCGRRHDETRDACRRCRSRAGLVIVALLVVAGLVAST